MSKVAVVDYGMGNLLSVCRALAYCGANVTLTSDPPVLLSADRVILPGVGAFADGMAGLSRHRLDLVLKDVATRGVPLLGICLGMQMLFDESEEFGLTRGLGLIPGRVVPIPRFGRDGRIRRIPHIGWNELGLSTGQGDWRNTLLRDVPVGSAVYFVHSFMAQPQNPEHRMADCNYEEQAICAVVGREKIFGCQFHPEKSGEFGLALLRQFLAA